jgi:multidrug efflux system outer membrane protein
LVPTGLPSELLCRRPDVAEAERDLAAAYREVGVAYANFFPSLTLNAAIGFEAPFAHQLFSWKSRFWQIGVSVMQTVFDGGRNCANLEFYRARFSEAFANYQETVLQAFKDVEDSLVDLRWFANRAQDLDLAVSAARTTLELSQMRYDRGLVNFLDVTDAERQLLETEQSSVIVLGNRYVSTVMLIRALGGGWGPCESCDE